MTTSEEGMVPATPPPKRRSVTSPPAAPRKFNHPMERLERGKILLKSVAAANEHNIGIATQVIEWVRSYIDTIENLRPLLEIFDSTPYRTQPQRVVEIFQGVRRSALKVFVRKSSSMALIHDKLEKIKKQLEEYSELTSEKMASGHRKLRNIEEDWPKMTVKARRLVLQMEIISKVDSDAVATALPKIKNAIALLKEARPSLRSSIEALYALIEQDEDLVWGAMPP